MPRVRSVPEMLQESKAGFAIRRAPFERLIQEVLQEIQHAEVEAQGRDAMTIPKMTTGARAPLNTQRRNLSPVSIQMLAYTPATLEGKQRWRVKTWCWRGRFVEAGYLNRSGKMQNAATSRRATTSLSRKGSRGDEQSI